MNILELEIQRPKSDKNFARNIMPQIRKGDLVDSPFTFSKATIRTDKLKPVQNQRVKGMHNKAKRGFADGTIRPIIVDKDNYIVNGHHRFDIALHQGLKKVKIIKVDSTIEDLIDHFSKTVSDEPTYEQKFKQKMDEIFGGGGVPDYKTMPAYKLKKKKVGKHKFFVPSNEPTPKGVSALEDVVDGNFPTQQRDREMQQGMERELKMHKVLERLAQMWWNNNEDPTVERKLADMGWEIGEDEGSDTPSVFVVEIGDENGNSYTSWPIEQLENDVVENFSGTSSDVATFEAYIKEKLAKAMEEELEEDWKNVARAGLATAALGMGVAGMDSITPDDFAPDKPQAVKSVDNDIDRNLAEFEKSSKEFNDLYNKYVQKFTDEAKNSFDRNHIKDKAELQTIKHWLKMFNSRADFTDYLNKTYPDRVKAQQDTNINNTMPNSMPDRVGENFADGKKKGKSKPGRVKKAGASCDGSVTSLRKKAKNSSGEKSKMYHWCANMKSGKK